MNWLTHKDGGMWLDCRYHPTLDCALIMFRYDSHLWIAYAATRKKGDVWLHHAEKDALLANFEATLRLMEVIE